MKKAVLLILVALVSLAGAICGLKPQVMADVDDAILHPSEFGVGFMGIDESHEETTGNIQQMPNPGAGQFLRELSRGPLDLINPEGIVILSARPNTNIFKDALNKACQIFPPLWFGCQQLKNLINDAFPDLVNQEINSVGSTVKAELGSPPSDFIFTSFQDLWQKFADRKVINQAAFHAQNPGQFKYILVDDNANGGHVAAARMLNDLSTCVSVAFIHDVVNSPKNFIKNPNPIHPLTGKIDPLPMPANLVIVQNDPTRYVLYRNFAHASILALQRGLISLAGKNRIVAAIKATTAYKNCVAQAATCAPGDDEDHCDPGCAELRADVDAAAVFILRREATTQEFPVTSAPTCDRCTAWTRWSACEDGVRTRQCTTIPNCIERERCELTCDDCDRWVDLAACSKPGDVVVQQCATAGLEKCQRRRICSCDDCTLWSDPVPEKCTKGPGECLDIQCKTPGFEECKSRIVCTCDDCPEWSAWSTCDGLDSVSERRCVTPGWTVCQQTRQCPADDITSKKQIQATAQATCDQCTSWTRWSPCDSSTGVSTRQCLTIRGCVETRQCTCDDCPSWSEWDKCLSLTDTSIRTCTHTRFPNCYQRKPCTCRDCQGWTAWSDCVNGVRTRKCTHISGCTQTERCEELTCDDCDRWVDLAACSKPGDVVVQQCATAGLEKCQRRRICSCDDCTLWSDPVPEKCTKGPGECLDIQCKTPGFEECKSRIVCTCDDCPEWSAWSTCNGLGSVSERRCVTPGWTVCQQTRQCPADDVTLKRKQIRASVQAIDSARSEVLPPIGADITFNSASAGGSQAIFIASALCVFLSLTALVIFAVVRSHRKTTLETLAHPGTDIL